MSIIIIGTCNWIYRTLHLVRSIKIVFTFTPQREQIRASRLEQEVEQLMGRYRDLEKMNTQLKSSNKVNNSQLDISLIIPCTHASKACSSWFMISDFLKATKKPVLANVHYMQAQHNMSSNLIVLDFVLFTIYGVICSLQTLLWCIPNFIKDKSAHNTCKSTCILKLGSTILSYCTYSLFQVLQTRLRDARQEIQQMTTPTLHMPR